MVRANLFTDNLIEGNFIVLKHWAQAKCNSVIQFKEFSKTSKKIEMYDVR